MRTDPSRVFLLSPANCRGPRGQLLLSSSQGCQLARRLGTGESVPIGELFAFVSGVYFRGKLAYARRFARPPDPGCPLTAGGVLVITPGAGLRGSETPITRAALQRFAGVDVRPDNPTYRDPLLTSARALLTVIGRDCEVVLLGSIATPKYVEVLREAFPGQLRYPVAFVGRGDMSRGGLMLERAASGRELAYRLVADSLTLDRSGGCRNRDHRAKE